MRTVMLTSWFVEALADLDNADQGRVFRRVNAVLTDTHVAGANFERIDEAADANIFSMKVNRGHRIILHMEGDTCTLLHVGKHDQAYAWLKQRRVGRHPITHEFQLRRLPHDQDATVPVPAWQRRLRQPDTSTTAELTRSMPDTPPFADASKDLLLSYGVPTEWIQAVLAISTVDDIGDHLEGRLPIEVTDRLIAHAFSLPVNAVSLVLSDGPVATSQLIPVTDVGELQEALRYPLDRWIAFLHPDQRRLATVKATGPIKVTGSAGTGKTTLALHRARHLAMSGRRVLVTTYTRSLAANLERQLHRLCPELMMQRRIIVQTVFRAASRILSAAGEPNFRTVSDADLRTFLPLASGEYSRPWLISEWRQVIDARNVKTLDAYLGVDRTGRGRALTEAQRREVWATIEPFLRDCASANRWSWADVALHARQLMEQANRNDLLASAFVGGGVTAVVVDEMQDLGPSELRFLASVAGSHEDALFLTGDAAQRIYGRRFTLRSCGIHVVGRSSVLRVNYRTTGQIRRFADSIATSECDDMDAGYEQRKGVRSVMSGPLPVVLQAESRRAEVDALVTTVRSWLDETEDDAPNTPSDAASKRVYREGDIAVFTRTNELASIIRQALRDRDILAEDLDTEVDGIGNSECVTVATLHKAKGLEFKAVAVVATDLIPLLESEIDAEDLTERESQERDLLYVGTTRARDALFVSWSGEPSRFLLDALTSTDLVQAEG